MHLYKLRRTFLSFFVDANIWIILTALLCYSVVSYVGLWLAGESELIAVDTFVYWLFVTASTVGYGDFSPATAEGKLFTALFVIPFGLSLFAIIVAKIGMLLSEFIKRGKKGLRMVRSTNHCIIIGWNGSRTLKLIRLLLAKQNSHSEKIVLVVDSKMENPLPNKIEFVSVEGYTEVSSMMRANLSEAARIIIDTPQDDVTLSTALFCKQHNPGCHKTVYFQQESMADLLLPYCPGIEIVPSVSVEMLARSSVDPGSSQLHQQLLDPTIGSSQFSGIYTGDKTVSFKDAFITMKESYNATLVGIRDVNSSAVTLNPPNTHQIKNGCLLYYIAESRLNQLSSLG